MQQAKKNDIFMEKISLIVPLSIIYQFVLLITPNNNNHYFKNWNINIILNWYALITSVKLTHARFLKHQLMLQNIQTIVAR